MFLFCQRLCKESLLEVYHLKVLVLGAGLMGRGAAYYLAHTDKVEQFIVADIDEKAANGLAKEFGEKAVAERVDARDKDQLISLFSRVDSVISAISYTVNELHTEVAIETGANMVDLGGNIFVHEKQFAMHDKAKEAGVTVIPDIGLAPGMTNVLARAGIDQLSRTDSVQLRVGGLQQDPRPPLNYSLIFSVEGLINEYVEPCRILRNGKIAMEDPLVGFEELEFPEPFGKLEAFNTSGGTSTLPITYEGKIDNLDYKTIRYPGHGHKMWCIYKLGLMDNNEMEFDGTRIAPRRVLERLLEENLPPTGKDVTLVRCTIEGWKGTESRTIQYQLIDYFDDETKLTSMMRTTSFPAAAVAVMCADGTITERGVLAPEVAIPPQVFIEEMRNRGIDIEERVF
ncbi:MAG: saccharopine dehydrogenase family protein [Candidatus Thorarchaeota archaeon]